MDSAPESVPASDEVLLMAAGDCDLDAMRELARRENPEYLDAFRQACIDVLGEDPDDWGSLREVLDGD